MPEYAYQDIETGEEIIVVESMADTPPVGTEVEYAGRKLRKLPPIGVMGQDRTEKPFVAYSRQRWHPAGTKFTKNGHLVINGKKDRVEFMAKANALSDKTGGPKIAWDK